VKERKTKGMGAITYRSALIYVELLTYSITDDLRHCETFIDDTYDDGHARSRD